MPFRIRLGGKSRYPRYVGQVKEVGSVGQPGFPRAHTHGVRSRHATEFGTEAEAEAHRGELLEQKDRLQPDEQRQLEQATIEEF